MASDFLYQTKLVLFRNRDGSHATQAERKKVLTLVDRQLREMGTRKLQLRNLGSRHIDRLLDRWKSEGLAAGTIKNRMCHLRWLSEKIGKGGLCANSNDAMGIPRRKLVSDTNRAVQLNTDALKRVSDPYLNMSFRLQAAFGLRREESMKLRPREADKGDHLALTITKGGRPRNVPIRTEKQRQLLEEAKVLAKGGSLIPAELKYVQQMKRYERACIRMGLSRAHGLRHSYAQERYGDLTGRLAPVAGGASASELSEAEKLQDHKARLQISEELGHSREEVTAVYLGR